MLGFLFEREIAVLHGDLSKHNIGVGQLPSAGFFHI